MTQWTEPVAAPCADSIAAARERQSQLTKPPGSLGRLEELAIAFAGFQRRIAPQLDDIAIRIFAADHGVVEEGVSAFPQSVTVQMIQNFSAGGAAITVLARKLGASFRVINLGTVSEIDAGPGVDNLQLASGTANFCHTAAMSPAQLQKAMLAGAGQVVPQQDLFVGGEMGIGNTTAAAALCSALLGLSPVETVGRGTGVSDSGLNAKREVVERALALHVTPDVTPMEVLRRLGGLEIAALVGAYIAAAQQQVPVLVDGYICTSAALVACRINPDVRPWLLFSHASAEPGHRHVLSALEARPLLDLGMRLGEGSGAAIALPLIQSACVLHNEMATFAEAGVSAGEP